ncbi:MAG: signal recognition particle-docking protein FtsY [Acidimicrobiales bacterium]|nr:signal recognition particle-docking protein FtsY [Hyphomonadaceae bacterium]RZV44595.1 MAG: signal recognition particle-docking protein FtsY [Acidimicrobiales bacterium]
MSDDEKKKKKGFFAKAFGLKSKEEKLAEAAALKAEQAAEVDRQMAERMAAINAAALKSAREQDEAAGDGPSEAEKARLEAEEKKKAEEQARKDVEAAKKLADEKRLAAEKAKAEAEAKAKELEEKAKAAEAKRIAEEKAEAERLAKEKAEAEAEAARIKARQEAAAKAEAERLAAERARLKAEQEAAAQAEKERIKAEKEAEKERIRLEKEEAKQRAAETKAEAKRKALEEKERIKAEKAAIALAKKEQGKAEAEALKAKQEEERATRLLAEKEAADKAEAERLEAERLAAEQVAAEAERLAAEKAEAERLAAEAKARQEQEDAERLKRERAEAEEQAAQEAKERVDRETALAEQEQQAKEKAEAERLEAEQHAAQEAEAAQAAMEKAEVEQLEAERIEKEAAEKAEADRKAAEEAQLAAEKAEAEAPAVDPNAPKKQGFFSRITSGLKKSSNRMADSVSSMFNKRKLDAEALEELEDLLIASDLGVAPAMRVTELLAKDKFDKQVTGMEIKIALADVIAETLKPLEKPLVLGNSKPEIVLFVGVNGSGKTTTLGKIAKRYTDQGKKVLIAAGDTFRAAAVEQLKVWGERANAPVISANLGADAAGLVYDAIAKAKAENYDILMIDTAGRLQNRTELMDELSKVVRVIKKQDETAPHHSILVLDATVGQNALLQTEAFLATAGITGLIMTKLDGTAKGGVLVALADKFKLPIHSIGIGERIEDLENFSADVFAAALSGVADAVIDEVDA